VTAGRPTEADAATERRAFDVACAGEC